MEKTILVGIDLRNEQSCLDELARLADTAGALVVGSIIQNREKPDLKYFIGSGKAEELKNLCLQKDAALVIFDNELTASQERNLEDKLGIKIVDRTELILDIFATHAHSREGKLQVELAQANFLLTRLTGWGVLMSRLGGGIGTRGPGETKLEMDRRRIKKRISVLKKEIEKIREQRTVRRRTRSSSDILCAAIVGYTNAGKSTFLNAMTKSDVLVENKLFATLDPTTRRLYLPDKKYILLTDTVGFIQKLPHQLVSAFKATLEEVVDADILIHIVDGSAPDLENQINAVYNVLEELGAVTKPIVTLFNKIDLLENKKYINRFLLKYNPSMAVSLKNFTPDSKSNLISFLHQACKV